MLNILIVIFTVWLWTKIEEKELGAE